MDARLALRTMEERVRALAGRADALRRAAENERQSRAKALARRERLRREAAVAARCTPPAGCWPRGSRPRIAAGRGPSGPRRTPARTEAEAALAAAAGRTVRTLRRRLRVAGRHRPP